MKIDLHRFFGCGPAIASLGLNPAVSQQPGRLAPAESVESPVVLSPPQERRGTVPGVQKQRRKNVTYSTANSDAKSNRLSEHLPDAASVYSDDFSTDDRVQWFEVDADSSTLSTKSRAGQLSGIPELNFAASDTSSLKSFVSHFPAIQLDRNGDSVTLQFDTRHDNIGFVNRAFRFGLFDSSGTTFTADGDLDFDSISLDDEGYFALLDLGSSTTSDSAVIRETNNAKDERLWNGRTISLDDNDEARDPLIFMRDRNYTYTLSLTRNADGKVNVVLKNNVSGEGGALTGTTSVPPTFRLDSIYFGTYGSSADFAFDNVTVSVGRSGDNFTTKGVNEGKLVVGVYVDKGAGPSVNDLLFVLGKLENLSIMHLTADDIRSGALSGLDVLIQPGGSGGGQGRHLGEQGREAIRGFVHDGGGFIGICAGAYVATSHYPWSLNILDAQVIDTRHWNRGVGTVKIAITDAGQGLLSTKQRNLPIHYAQGPLLAPGNRADIEDYATIATFETEVAKNGALAGVMVGTTAIAKGHYGRGKVICFSPHPEMTRGLEYFIQYAVDHVAKNRLQQTQDLVE